MARGITVTDGDGDEAFWTGLAVFRRTGEGGQALLRPPHRWDKSYYELCVLIRSSPYHFVILLRSTECGVIA